MLRSAFTLAAAMLLAPVASAKLTVTGVGGYTLGAPASPARELSDIAFDPGSGGFWAVSDKDNNLYPINLNINAATGAIQAGSIGAPLTLTDYTGTPFPTSRDQEGLSMISGTSSVIVSYESSPQIAYHRLSDGHMLGPTPINLSTAYPALRGNRGLEAVTQNATGTWIANEEAMTTDGPVAGGGAGTTIRLTEATIYQPINQYLYQTDGDSAGFTVQQSGVSGLQLLPDGSLLVLERAMSTDSVPNFRSRLYLVDTAGATDVLGVATPTGTETYASKTLVWSHDFPGLTNLVVNNFEGITIGPTLSDGAMSLVLIADNNFPLTPTSHNLYTLRLALTLPGDANNDGVVDANDFIAIESNVGALGDDNGLLLGDANDDGRVDGDDYLAVEQHFGDAWPASAPAALPEPGALASFAIFPALLSRRRR